MQLNALPAMTAKISQLLTASNQQRVFTQQPRFPSNFFVLKSLQILPKANSSCKYIFSCLFLRLRQTTLQGPLHCLQAFQRCTPTTSCGRCLHQALFSQSLPFLLRKASIKTPTVIRSLNGQNGLNISIGNDYVRK